MAGVRFPAWEFFFSIQLHLQLIFTFFFYIPVVNQKFVFDITYLTSIANPFIDFPPRLGLIRYTPTSAFCSSASAKFLVMFGWYHLSLKSTKRAVKTQKHTCSGKLISNLVGIHVDSMPYSTFVSYNNLFLNSNNN